ncbi:MAG: peroxiredoxin [Bradymonadia bacterium]
MIAAGDLLPEGKLKTLVDDGVIDLHTKTLFTGKRIVLFAVPGAFTPGCSQNHLPGYVAAAEQIRGRGFDEIACLAVNDAWVMKAWAKTSGADGKILMLSDGSAEYVSKLGLQWDLTAAGMGIRSRRFSMIVVDGVIEKLFVDKAYIDQTSAQYTCGL